VVVVLLRAARDRERQREREAVRSYTSQP
jgi:hypothetical protein